MITFSHQSVRELAWVIASPPLAIPSSKSLVISCNEAFCQQEYQTCYGALCALDKDPTPLHLHLASYKGKALGQRFEALVAYWLKISERYEIVEQNKQLFVNGITVGEMDFIIYDKQERLTAHLEVAVKFYMGIADLTLAHNWYGTNRKDQLSSKLSRLETHQTQLSKLYPELMPCRIDQSLCFVKGRLFYPYNNHDEYDHQHSDPSHSVMTYPNSVDSQHLRGRWFEVNDEKNVDLYAHDLIPLTKDDWLAPLSPDEIEQRQHNRAEQQQLLKLPQCFARIDGQQLVEKERVFILPYGYLSSLATFKQDKAKQDKASKS